MSTKNRICLDNELRTNYVEKKVLGAGIKPGHLLSINTSDEVSLLGTGNTGLILIALENWLLGGVPWGATGGIMDAYVVGDQCLTMIPRRGERYNVRVPASAVAILKNQILVPNLDGTISKMSGSVGGEIIASVGPSTPIVATVTTIVPYDVTATIPANSLNVDDVVHIHGVVNVLDNNSTDTLTVTVKLGSVTIAASVAFDVADADICVFDLYLHIRTVGASGTYVLTGEIGIGPAASATMRPVYKASTALDTTAAHIITVNQTWSAAHADNEAELIELTASKDGKANVAGGLVFSADEALDNSAGITEALIEARVL